MSCFDYFLNWLNFENIPDSEKSILEDLKTIGIINED